MRPLYGLILLVGGITASWWLIPRLVARGMLPAPVWSAPGADKHEDAAELPMVPALPPPKSQSSLRICSWNVTPLTEEKLLTPGVAAALAAVIRQFDVIVLQGVDLRDRGVIARLMDYVNRDRAVFSYATLPESLRVVTTRGIVVVFDLSGVEIDRRTVRVVDDPLKRLQFLPLTAAFRARGVPPQEAFTFTLIGVQVDTLRAEEETDLLDDVFRAVRDDGRGEDDIILAGYFGDRTPLRQGLSGLADVVPVMLDIPTTVDGKGAVDGFFLDRRATTEYTGKHGVMDLVRQFKISAGQAAQVADHLPVWAEFSTREGIE
ncbi:exonuclease/endonuclease/phosphatase family protein [Thermopirellula anaerolimosa]